MSLHVHEVSQVTVHGQRGTAHLAWCITLKESVGSPVPQVARGKCKSLRSIAMLSGRRRSCHARIARSEQHVSTAHAALLVVLAMHTHTLIHKLARMPPTARRTTAVKFQQGYKNLGTMPSLRSAAHTHCKRGSGYISCRANHHGGTLAFDAVMRAVTTTAVLLLTSTSPVCAMMSARDIPGADPSGRLDSAPALNRALAEMCGNASMSREAPSLVVLDLDGGVCVAHIHVHAHCHIHVVNTF